MATDYAGTPLWKENFDQRKSLWDTPFGDRVVKAPLAANNRNWFAGKPSDNETGLSYFGARYYDLVIERFMGMDPAA